MGKLSKDEIKAAADIHDVEVDVPEWGGTVTVRTLSQKQLADIHKRCTNRNGDLDNQKVTMALLIDCMVDPKCTEEDEVDLGRKSAGAITRVTTAILEASGLTKAAAAAAEKSFRP